MRSARVEVPQPFLKWYWSDWDSDKQLLECSASARGVWSHMFGVMVEAEPYGYFVGRAGQVVSPAAFAGRINIPLREVRKGIAEILEKGVASRDADGRIFCRRLVLDRSKYEMAAENGKTGGNPTLKAGVNPQDNQSHKLAGARGQADANSQKLRSVDNLDSLRSSAVAFGDWPVDVSELQRLAAIFLSQFANCRDATKADKYLPAYTTTLAVLRSRGVSIDDAWKACADAKAAFGNKPLFGSSIKSAIGFLPARANGRTGKPARVAPMFSQQDLGNDE